jgi:hypothetical protein
MNSDIEFASWSNSMLQHIWMLMVAQLAKKFALSCAFGIFSAVFTEPFVTGPHAEASVHAARPHTHFLYGAL